MNSADLESLLESSDPEDRRRATSELFVRASDAPTGNCGLVLKALADEDWRVRKEAIATAFALAPSPELLEELVRALAPGDNVGLRNAAVEALGAFGAHAVAALARALPTLDADGRKLAVEALGRVGHDSALPVLVGAIADVDPNVRVAAVEAASGLARAGVLEAIGTLEKCLEAAEPMLVLAALDGLNSIGAALPFSTVEALLEQPMLRRPALLAAGRTGDPRAIAPVVSALERARGGAFIELVSAGAELARRRELIPSIRAAGTNLTEKTRQKLLALCADEIAFDDARRAALVAAAALGIDSVAELAVTLLGDDRFMAEGHEVIELLGERAMPTLIRTVQQRQLGERAACLALLGRLASKQRRELLLATALDALSDELNEVRREALAIIARHGGAELLAALARSLPELARAPTLKAHEAALRALALRHPVAARALIAAAEPNGLTAHAACLVLAAITPVRGASPADLEFLSTALGSPLPAVRRSAVDALAEVAAEGALDALSFAVTDEEESVREVAIAALGRLRDRSGRAAGFERLREIAEGGSQPSLRARALRALGDTHDERAQAVLEPFVASTTAVVAVTAVEALAKLSAPLEQLLAALEHQDAEVVKAGMFALSERSDSRVEHHLVGGLEHESPDVRALAAELLARHPTESVRAELRSRLSLEPAAVVREALMRSLDRVSGVRRTPPLALGGSLPPR